MMKHKGYIGHAVYEPEAKVFCGHVIGLRDVITFEGTTVDELEQAFRDSVEFYLGVCQQRGETPEKTFSGNVKLRLTPELHAYLIQEAVLSGKSLNSFIVEKLKK